MKLNQPDLCMLDLPYPFLSELQKYFPSTQKVQFSSIFQGLLLPVLPLLGGFPMNIADDA